MWVNCYVFGYADYENQYEKNIKIILGGMSGPQSRKNRHFPTFSYFLFFLGNFEIRNIFLKYSLYACKVNGFFRIV